MLVGRPPTLWRSPSTRWRSLTIALWAAIGLSASPPSAHAAPGEGTAAARGGPRVVVVARSAGDPMVARVRDELELLGVVVVARGAPHDRVELGTLAARDGAAAVVWVEPWPPEIVIWVDPTAEQEPYGPPTELRVSDSLVGEPRPALLALRAVELLRGRLLPVEPPRPEPTSPPQPGTSSAGSSQLEAPAGGAASQAPSAPSGGPAGGGPEPAGSRRPPAPHVGEAGASGQLEPARDGEVASRVGAPRAWIGLSPALAVSPGGLPAAFQLRIGGGAEIGWRIGLEAAAWIPTAAVTVAEDEGSVGVRTLTLGALAVVRLTAEDSAFGALLGAGIGANALWYEGQANPPYRSASGSHWAAAPCIELAGRYRFIDWLALRADLALALVRPEPVLRVAGRDVASWGQPSVLVGIGLEVLP